MPRVRINGAKVHYEEEGRGRETIVFAHGLLFSGRMFESQVQATTAGNWPLTRDSARTGP